jgi:Na+/H+ antiporter NhaC
MNDAQIFKAQLAAAQGLSLRQLLIIAVAMIAIVVWFFRKRNKNKPSKPTAQKQMDSSSLSPIVQDTNPGAKEKLQLEELSVDEKIKSPDYIPDKIPMQQTLQYDFK